MFVLFLLLPMRLPVCWWQNIMSWYFNEIKPLEFALSCCCEGCCLCYAKEYCIFCFSVASGFHRFYIPFLHMLLCNKAVRVYLQVFLDVIGYFQHVLRLEAFDLLPQEGQGQDGRLDGWKRYRKWRSEERNLTAMWNYFVVVQRLLSCDPVWPLSPAVDSYLCFREGDPAQTGFELSLQLLQTQSLLPVTIIIEKKPSQLLTTFWDSQNCKHCKKTNLMQTGCVGFWTQAGHINNNTLC